MNRNQTDGGGKGWTHDLFGYVYPFGEDVPIIPLSVGYESRFWTTLVQQSDHLQVIKYWGGT